MNARAAAPSSLRLALRLAAREMRGGLAGFAVFIACLALGVAAIAGVGSVARGLAGGLASQSRSILGGDLDFTLVQHPPSKAQYAYLDGLGDISIVVRLRAMVRSQDGAPALAEVKAVDGAYPLAGTLGTEPAGPLAPLLARRGEVFGAVADPALLARLGLEPGEELKLGTLTLQVRASLIHEPDALSGGIGFGPRLMISRRALDASGLVRPGSLVTYGVRIRLPAGTSAAAARRVADAAKARFPDAGWRVRTREQATRQIADDVERFTQFLTIVGLVALVVGGVGVANGVAAYMDRKREVVAVLKCLGAGGGQVFAVYLLQVMAIALVAIVIGLAIGAALPFVVGWTLGALLPIPYVPAVEPWPLLLAAAYGILVALAFALWPLGRAHDMPVAALFREEVATRPAPPRWRYRILVALAVLAVAALAVLTAVDRLVALVFLGAAAVAFLALRYVARGIMAGARRLPRPRGAVLRLALANVHRPGALTPSVVVSLGLGLTLLVGLALIDHSIRTHLTAGLPERAPSFFFVDLTSAETPAFAHFLAKEAPGSTLRTVPMLRGRIVALKGIAAAKYPATGNAKSLLRGDRGVTFAAAVPENSHVDAGTWWPANYAGPPLVSFEDKLARDLGLKVGDDIAVNVLGRVVTARIANLRKVDWESLGINFFMVFSPDTFRGAPYQNLATLTLAKGQGDAAEFALLRKTAAQFPAVVAVRVKEALSEIAAIVGKLALAVRAASSIALIAGALVLAGALAAGHRQRLYDAVILKTLGATRPRILLAFALEYLALGLATAVFGVVAGALAAWAITAGIMHIPFAFDAATAAVAVFGALIFTVGLGLAGTWRLVGAKPAPVLRNL